MNIFKKTPLIISATLFIVLAVALFFLHRQINLNNANADVSTTELTDEQSRRDEIRLLNNSIETIKEDKALLETHFGKSSDVVPFLDTIEALGPKVGVKAETISVDVAPDNTSLRVKINATGDFKNIYKFLTLLENSPYELEIISMDIQKQGDTAVPMSSGQTTPALTQQSSKWQGAFDIKLKSFIQ